MAETTTSPATDTATDELPSRVAPLSELFDEYEIADGYPDVRGWDVRDSAGRSIGYVYDLLVDVAALRVRYLDVELDPEFAGSDADRRVLIPMENLDFDRDRDEALLRGVDVTEVRALVPYARRGVMREREVVAPSMPASTAAPEAAPRPDADTEVFVGRHFDDERLFGGAGEPSAGQSAEGAGLSSQPDRLIGEREMRVGDVAGRPPTEAQPVRERPAAADDAGSRALASDEAGPSEGRI